MVSMEKENPAGYVQTDGGYDDCIMQFAVGLVNPDHYQLTWFGHKSKCNCQDYASALRAKYRELENDPEIKCKWVCKVLRQKYKGGHFAHLFLWQRDARPAAAFI